ncbi:Imm21 family immunity protein [Streptomyces sp. NPDC005533]|uniref:Imm21 family immunity protein n=1 Tax=Streptomyces sp. NPDC005533 TaxID=3364723 RepID=UPI0036B0CA57
MLTWLAADSDTELLAAAQSVLRDPVTPWEKCGVWETDGPVVLVDSVEAGADLRVPYSDGRGRPAEAPVAVPAGRWEVRACDKTRGVPLGWRSPARCAARTASRPCFSLAFARCDRCGRPRTRRRAFPLLPLPQPPPRSAAGGASRTASGQ